MIEEVLYENKSNSRSIGEDGFKIYLKKNIALRIIKIISYFFIFKSILDSWKKEDYILVLYCIFLFFCLLFHTKISYLIVKKKQKYSFDLERTYKFYDNRFEVVTEISKSIIPYDRIKIAFENEKAFYMVFERSLFCIDKNGFIVGNNINFDKFIKSKVKFK